MSRAEVPNTAPSDQKSPTMSSDKGHCNRLKLCTWIYLIFAFVCLAGASVIWLKASQFSANHRTTVFERDISLTEDTLLSGAFQVDAPRPYWIAVECERDLPHFELVHALKNELNASVSVSRDGRRLEGPEVRPFSAGLAYSTTISRPLLTVEATPGSDYAFDVRILHSAPALRTTRSMLVVEMVPSYATYFILTPLLRKGQAILLAIVATTLFYRATRNSRRTSGGASVAPAKP